MSVLASFRRARFVEKKRASSTDFYQGAVLFASATSALSWGNIAESHWTARTLFFSCIVLALVAIVTGAQQQMVLPGDDPHLQDMDLSQIIATITGIRQSNNTAKKHNHGLIFALQAPLMLFSLAVALFLAGLFSVVFNPLGSSPLWGDNAKVCAIIASSFCFSGIAIALTRFLVPDRSIFWNHECNRHHCVCW